ncbi:cupin domain-containing protein [Sphingobium sp. SJ10-10]|uniref:cupin domain-containing protein n=1 Tax=unclassified Sphingobium TaxID=2611147 RepID=UPI0007703DC6|nr:MULTISPECIES: cupin domain-containing protein [unclassified Sphingobium]AMK24671.1 hypothetical protein K426_18705 [Sphingobium sp. TKS]MEC6698200.1 cupin domain-containing protein [Sphingobium sp. SJ10-10]
MSMTRRRVVAAERNGKSVIIDDVELPEQPFLQTPGFSITMLWQTAPAAEPGRTPHISSIIPGPGGTALLFVTFPPDAVMADPRFDPNAAGREYLERLPGLAELFEPDNPGMHRTPTIDYDIVFDGCITAELDDGQCVDLKRGDVLVQHGTRHAWRNRSQEPATMIFVLVAAGDNQK